MQDDASAPQWFFVRWPRIVWTHQIDGYASDASSALVRQNDGLVVAVALRGPR